MILDIFCNISLLYTVGPQERDGAAGTGWARRNVVGSRIRYIYVHIHIYMYMIIFGIYIYIYIYIYISLTAYYDSWRIYGYWM